MGMSKPLRVYIAGRMTERHLLVEWREKVRGLGFLCDCKWIDAPDNIVETIGESRMLMAKYANADLDDVEDSHIFILDLVGTGGGGRFFEYGVAYARGKICCVVGMSPGSIFDALSPRFDNWPEVLGWLEEIKHG